MIVLKKGAEADLLLDEEKKTVIKDRKPKAYREKVLDESIRKKRTRSESRILKKAHDLGIPVPRVIEAEDSRIIMEHIPGSRVKDIIDKDNLTDIMPKIGKIISDLHKSDIIHGDLTTSNLIAEDNKIYIIDFGLGSIDRSTEKKAVDLHLFEETFSSTHKDLKEDGLKLFFDSYRKNYPGSKTVLDRLMKVESRGRYVKREKE